MIVLTTTRIMLIIMLRMLTKTEMKFMMSVRWMHFKTVHVNTGWMTTADETGEPWQDVQKLNQLHKVIFNV